MPPFLRFLVKKLNPLCSVQLNFKNIPGHHLVQTFFCLELWGTSPAWVSRQSTFKIHVVAFSVTYKWCVCVVQSHAGGTKKHARRLEPGKADGFDMKPCKEEKGPFQVGSHELHALHDNPGALHCVPGAK
jgi:hypothetical protein